MRWHMRSLCAAFLACFCQTQLAVAQNAVAEFYKGRTIEFIIGYGPGAGYDLFGRILVQFMGRHIAGSPAMVAKNKPGASSLTGLKYIASQAPRDGTTIGIFNPTLINLSVLEPGQVDVDFDALTWIGNKSNDTKVCFASRQSGIRTADDIRTGSIIVGGGGGAQGSGFVYGAILKEIFGDHVKTVLGYPSNPDVWLAFDRGEAEGNCTGWGVVPTLRPEWVNGVHINVFVQFARTPNPQLTLPGISVSLG